MVKFEAEDYNLSIHQSTTVTAFVKSINGVSYSRYI